MPAKERYNNFLLKYPHIGPYRSGTNDDPALMKANLDHLESVALPLIKLAGSTKPGWRGSVG